MTCDHLLDPLAPYRASKGVSSETPFMSDETIARQGIPIQSWTDNLEQDLLRQLKEERLNSEQLRLLGTAIHVAGLGIAILTPAVEVDGPRVSFVNDGFCEIYGRQREEIIGQTT